MNALQWFELGVSVGALLTLVIVYFAWKLRCRKRK